MFNNPSNYFFWIGFKWKDIFHALDIPESERSHFKIEDSVFYTSKQASDSSGLGINSEEALFEYYILAKTLKNGKHQYSTIYDQQLKRFFETPNINYGTILKDGKNVERKICCIFNKSITKEKSGFLIGFSGEDEGGFLNNKYNWKTLAFLFDTYYLDMPDAQKKWGEEINVDILEIIPDKNGNPKISRKNIDKNLIRIGTNIQSQEDGCIPPFSVEISKFLD